MKRYRERVNDLAKTSDEPLRSRLFEYALLHAELTVLTGAEHANEAALSDITMIQDDAERARAAKVARRMRMISRQVGSKLTE